MEVALDEQRLDPLVFAVGGQVGADVEGLAAAGARSARRGRGRRRCGPSRGRSGAGGRRRAAQRRPGPAASRAPWPTRNAASTTKATPTAQVLGPDQRGQPEEEAGQEPGPQPLLLARPEEGEDGGRQGEDRRRLAEEGAGRVDEGRVDGDAEGGDQPGRAAGDPPPEQEDDDDRRQPEQQLDDPRRPFARAAGRVEGAGVEQRRARRPVAGVVGIPGRRSCLPRTATSRGRSRRGRRRPGVASGSTTR